MAVEGSKFPHIKNGIGTTDATGRITVVFDEPYNNANYAVATSPIASATAAVVSHFAVQPTGFKIGVADTSGAPVIGIDVTWITVKYVNG